MLPDHTHGLLTTCCWNTILIKFPLDKKNLFSLLFFQKTGGISLFNLYRDVYILLSFVWGGFGDLRGP